MQQWRCGCDKNRFCGAGRTKSIAAHHQSARDRTTCSSSGIKQLAQSTAGHFVIEINGVFHLETETSDAVRSTEYSIPGYSQSSKYLTMPRPSAPPYSPPFPLPT
jgi:hypothetical protein